MAQEKQGVVRPGVTRDTEGRLPKGTKLASQGERTRALDDDFTKRAAETAAKKLK